MKNNKNELYLQKIIKEIVNEILNEQEPMGIMTPKQFKQSLLRPKSTTNNNPIIPLTKKEPIGPPTLGQSLPRPTTKPSSEQLKPSLFDIGKMRSTIDKDGIIRNKDSKEWDGKNWSSYQDAYGITSNEVDSAIKYYTKYVNIVKWQNTLKELGLYDGAIDGKWGPKTDAGYKKYMRVKNPQKASPEVLAKIKQREDQSQIQQKIKPIDPKLKQTQPQKPKDPGEQIFKNNIDKNLNFRNNNRRDVLIWKGNELPEGDLKNLNAYLDKSGYKFKRERDKGEGQFKYKWVRK